MFLGLFGIGSEPPRLQGEIKIDREKSVFGRIKLEALFATA
jgi:hypothetical protein